jgi:glycosyltransferase involved in cell wall biosynthesis
LLSGYDLVAVPSQWLETGPLVVLEAFAAGRPVIGSALGGIADKVRDGIDGLLVTPYDSAEAWATRLATCAAEPDLVSRLTAGVRRPRELAAVASEMDAVYRRVATVGSKR